MADDTGSILEAYEERTPGSRALYERAARVFPSGITHDGRHLSPYPLAVRRAQGARKWDVDGNVYIDYFGGHGALLLGHNHPEVTEAAREQLARGTHYGASHELEVAWAEQITRMVPCAEKVRFTSSGTEATMMSLRIARAYTGRQKILRFGGHFHGWHAQVAFGAHAASDAPPHPGIPDAFVRHTVLCEANAADQVRDVLQKDADIAAVILEPTGASFGRVPTSGGFLQELRKATHAYGVLLIFDEVITGFRVAPGGAQAHYGVTPDLSTFAKVVAGGFPGGAVAGRADVMDVMTMRDDAEWNQHHRIPHQGTFNANPLSASAGLAALRIIEKGEATGQANRNGELLREAIGDTIRREGADWVVYGEFSGFHLLPLPRGESFTCADIYAGKVPPAVLKGGTSTDLTHTVRRGLIAEGVDVFPWPGGVVSAVHTEDDIAQTGEAFARLLRRIGGTG